MAGRKLETDRLPVPADRNVNRASAAGNSGRLVGARLRRRNEREVPARLPCKWARLTPRRDSEIFPNGQCGRVAMIAKSLDRRRKLVFSLLLGGEWLKEHAPDDGPVVPQPFEAFSSKRAISGRCQSDALRARNRRSSVSQKRHSRCFSWWKRSIEMIQFLRRDPTIALCLRSGSRNVLRSSHKFLAR